MPFTLAHPAAALPLWHVSSRGLPLAALVLGSACPDYQYFFYLSPRGSFGHTFLGLFLFCLPLGWLSLWLYDNFGRYGIQRLLPDSWHLPLPGQRQPVLVSLALLIGAASHILWDSFTHASGWAVRRIPELAASLQLGNLSVPLYNVLQHSGSLLGLAVLAIACWKWARKQPPVSASQLLHRSFWPVTVLALAGLLNGLRFLSSGFAQFAVGAGVAVAFTFGAGLVLLGLLSDGRTPNADELPPMPAEEARRILSSSVGSFVQITFTDGITQCVKVGWVDNEGFGHSGNDGEKPLSFWTRLDSVASIHNGL